MIWSGTYEPTAYGVRPNMPAPAPVPNATTLSAFNGTDPNGTWKLFVYDDAIGPGPVLGKIAGSRCLTINDVFIIS